jgi:hypothetical protein
MMPQFYFTILDGNNSQIKNEASIFGIVRLHGLKQRPPAENCCANWMAASSRGSLEHVVQGREWQRSLFVGVQNPKAPVKPEVFA